MGGLAQRVKVGTVLAPRLDVTRCGHQALVPVDAYCRYVGGMLHQLEREVNLRGLFTPAKEPAKQATHL
jgi:hypothetical protein